MRREISGIVGVVGGLIDLWAGLSILLESSIGIGLMQGVRFLGYFLSVLGLVVLLTGMLMFVPRVTSRFANLLMMIYGLVMLVLGVGMIGGIINVMMQWSLFSGAVMIALGVLMLYTGSHMSKMRM